MSANFSIWHGECNEDGSVWAYVTAINVQELRQGSREFITMTLDDLGWSRSFPDSWHIGEPFAVEYLSADRTLDWRDSWLLTWRLTMRGSSMAALPSDPVDLVVWDSTWQGDEACINAFEIIAVGDDDASFLNDSAADSQHRCLLGHIHVSIPVETGRVDDAAQKASRLSDLLSERGWRTRWRPGLTDT